MDHLLGDSGKIKKQGSMTQPHSAHNTPTELVFSRLLRLPNLNAEYVSDLHNENRQNQDSALKHVNIKDSRVTTEVGPDQLIESKVHQEILAIKTGIETDHVSAAGRGAIDSSKILLFPTYKSFKSDSPRRIKRHFLEAFLAVTNTDKTEDTFVPENQRYKGQDSRAYAYDVFDKPQSVNALQSAKNDLGPAAYNAKLFQTREDDSDRSLYKRKKRSIPADFIDDDFPPRKRDPHIYNPFNCPSNVQHRTESYIPSESQAFDRHFIPAMIKPLLKKRRRKYSTRDMISPPKDSYGYFEEQFPKNNFGSYDTDILAGAVTGSKEGYWHKPESIAPVDPFKQLSNNYQSSEHPDNMDGLGAFGFDKHSTNHIPRHLFNTYTGKDVSGRHGGSIEIGSNHPRRSKRYWILRRKVLQPGFVHISEEKHPYEPVVIQGPNGNQQKMRVIDNGHSDWLSPWHYSKLGENPFFQVNGGAQGGGGAQRAKPAAAAAVAPRAASAAGAPRAASAAPPATPAGLAGGNPAIVVDPVRTAITARQGTTDSIYIPTPAIISTSQTPIRTTTRKPNNFLPTRITFRRPIRLLKTKLHWMDRPMYSTKSHGTHPSTLHPAKLERVTLRPVTDAVARWNAHPVTGQHPYSLTQGVTPQTKACYTKRLTELFVIRGQERTTPLYGPTASRVPHWRSMRPPFPDNTTPNGLPGSHVTAIVWPAEAVTEKPYMMRTTTRKETQVFESMDKKPTRATGPWIEMWETDPIRPERWLNKNDRSITVEPATAELPMSRRPFITSTPAVLSRVITQSNLGSDPRPIRVKISYRRRKIKRVRKPAAADTMVGVANKIRIRLPSGNIPFDKLPFPIRRLIISQASSAQVSHHSSTPEDNGQFDTTCMCLKRPGTLQVSKGPVEKPDYPADNTEPFEFIADIKPSDPTQTQISESENDEVNWEEFWVTSSKREPEFPERLITPAPDASGKNAILLREPATVGKLQMPSVDMETITSMKSQQTREVIPRLLPPLKLERKALPRPTNHAVRTGQRMLFVVTLVLFVISFWGPPLS